MAENEQIKLQNLNQASAGELAAAYRHCAAVVHKTAGNFYYAFLLLPKYQRNGIHALYAFCRAGDDAADDPHVEIDRHQALVRLRQRLDGCYNGQYSDHLTLALADAIHRFHFDRRDFDDLLLGIESDLSVVDVETEDDLLLYCYRVASTVGLLCLKIFGADDESDRQFAISLGKGMQLTNILRDIREDLQQGRLYIPSSLIRSAGATRESLFDNSNIDRLEYIVRNVAAIARNYFGRAKEALHPDHTGRLRSALAMGAIYEAILTRIEKNPVSPVKAELSRVEKLMLVRKLLVA